MRAARGTSNVGPREWVLTLELGEATLNAATRRREIGGREGDNIEHPDSTLAYSVPCAVAYWTQSLHYARVLLQ